ncbi:MAG: hypothetical protein A3K19_11765 [Lentisphaerae bacterium RIFOXYB12_FULL_65_16]|nr:MAG: hypothetical protein A3K18_23235 [Lentisphaerae bacterium RIFOXYA12_64_32]OGV87989.1 MAG: hypothetical protein A3K19_11765 [Lentisphaerae bacterium RIFOXYB12_FULL_65_16]
MKDCVAENIRNFTLAGHAGSGKTSLADLMLFKAGVVGRIGKVDQGTSVSDFRKEEQERRSSIFSAALHCPWKDHHFFYLDTPGYADFCGEAISAIQVADTVLIVVDAVAGLGPGAIRAWRQATQNNIPRAFFINGMDRDQASFETALKGLQDSYGAAVCIPFTVPVGEGTGLTKVVQVLQGGDVPPEVAEAVKKYRTALLDTAAESDEELMLRYLDGTQLTEAEIAKGLHKAINAGQIVPVFCGTADKDIGIEELMNGIVSFFPSPLGGAPMPLLEGGTQERTAADALGFVFKSVTDPFIGQMTFVRVYSGKFSTEGELHNLSRGGRERLGALLYATGKDQAHAVDAGPGEIIAIPKLKNVGLGDTVSMTSSAKKMSPIQYPQPTMVQAVFPISKGDEDKIGSGLQRLIAEDPTLKLERNPETKQTLLYGMGDQQINTIVNRLQSEFKVQVKLDTPKVPYRETITASGSAIYRHKKQTGGHGQFGEVHLRLDPLRTAEYEFVNEVVGGNIPKNFIPAVEKGVVEAMLDGPLARAKVINFKAAVFDGKYHPVDSSEMAFKIAARGAFRDAIKNARPILLEPIMKLKITFPEEYMGDITGDLNSRRGRILGMDREEGFQVVNAEVPMAETFTYPQQLRSITQGRGSFEVAFDRYDQVPSNVSMKVQETIAKDRQEQEE